MMIHKSGLLIFTDANYSTILILRYRRFVFTEVLNVDCRV
jgi:hypothetical protein